MLLLTLALCASVSWAGVAAYQLDGGTSVPAPISYWLSGAADSVTIDILDSTNAVVYTFPTITGTNAAAGYHANVVTWDGQKNGGGDAPTGNFKVRATVVTPADTDATKMPAIWGVSGAGYYGIAMCNNPNSALYGRVYVGAYSGTTPGKGIYEYNPDGTYVGKLPVPGDAYGGTAPFGLFMDADNHLYAVDYSKTRIYQYSYNGTAWTISGTTTATSYIKYIGGNFASGAALRLAGASTNFNGSEQPTPTCSLYNATGDAPASMNTAVAISPVTDYYMQPAIDAAGNVYYAGFRGTGTAGCVAVYDQAGVAKIIPPATTNRNTELSQTFGLSITPDDTTMYVARMQGYVTTTEKSTIYGFPRSEAMTITAASPNMAKYTLANAQQPRFISADYTRGNLAVAAGTNYVSGGVWFGLVREPSLTAVSEQRVGRQLVYWSGDMSPEFISGSATPGTVACGGSTTIAVTARDLNSIPSGTNDIASCKFFCPALGYGTAGDPTTGTPMTKLTGPDAGKQNTYSLPVTLAATSPTGPVAADIYIYDTGAGVQPGHGTVTINVTGGTITGVLTEGNSAKPAAGVTMRATLGTFYREAVTDANGVYTLNVTPGVGYSVAPMTSGFQLTYPAEYNLMKGWGSPADATTDWPKTADVTLGGSTTSSGNVYAVSPAQVLMDWVPSTGGVLRSNSRPVCVTGIVLRVAADSTATPPQAGYNGYYYVIDTRRAGVPLAVKVKPFLKGSEVKIGDRVVVWGNADAPSGFRACIVTPSAAPQVIASNVALPAPTAVTTASALTSGCIGHWFSVKGTVVLSLDTVNTTVYSVKAPDGTAVRVDLDTPATTGLTMPAVGDPMDLYGVSDQYPIWDIVYVLRPGKPGDAGWLGLVPDVSGAKGKADGDDVAILSARVTVVSGDVAYIETTGRTSALRVQKTGLTGIGSGDNILVSGKMATSAQGERYISATAATFVNTALPLDAIGMNNRDASSAKSLGMFVKTWGKVSSVGTDNFVISDGSPAPIKVMCGTLNKPTVGQSVRVRGAMSVDASGPVLIMRNEQVDWTLASASYQVLPFPGAYKYPREYLVLGPFQDSNSIPPASPGDPTPAQEYRLTHDFISDATGGRYTELTVGDMKPGVGVAVGSYAWKRAIAGTDNKISFTAAFPTNNTNCTFYAFLWVYSPIDQEIAMRVGSDDSIFVVANGTTVWQNQVNFAGDPSAVPPLPATWGRPETIGQDAVTWVPFYQGFNGVLYKVEQGVGGSGVDSQFISTGALGAAGWGGATSLTGLGYLLNNPMP